MYNVARYLPDFFASLRAQTYGFERIEVILVDDGSTDETAQVAERFAAQHANVRLVRKENGGQASARNLGLRHATGTWVTFPDPDDVVVPGYFADVATLLARADADLAMVTTRIVMWFEARPPGSQLADSHALAWRFSQGTRVLDLDEEPDVIQAHVTTGFLRRDIIAQHDLRFREELRLRFEDASLVARYLMTFRQRRIGLVATADYHYRQRADSSSTIQSTAADPRKYTDTVRYGFLDVIAAADGPLPRWAQNLMIYDVMWIFRSSQGAVVRRAQFPDRMHAELDELFPLWLAHIDDDAITGFSSMGVPIWMREVLLLWKRGSGHGAVTLGGIDPKRGLISLIYRYRGKVPAERITVGGREVQARYAKDWHLEYVGRPVAFQRYVWVPLDEGITIELDGEPQHIHVTEDMEGAPRVETGVISTRAVSAALKAEPPATVPKGIRRTRRRVGITAREVRAIVRERPGAVEAAHRLRVAWGAMSPRLAARFAGAWVFIDRDVDANDSAEILYKWVAREHPEINAWFVIRRKTPDWERLSNEGVRLVDYGSVEFAALILSAEQVASSHADRFISDPLPKRFGRRSWNFTFLQHGVIKGDISGWLNGKAIATFVTSTQDEYDYVTGPSPFRFGAKEVRLTGLPRFDALLAQDAAVPEGARDIVLFMPTWRDYLVGAMTSSSRDRSGVAGFGETAYARAVEQFLAHPGLAETLTREGARIVFMPHPNMRQYLASFRVPSHVEVVSYDDVDVREMVARARVLVTDYSSVAFNMAFVQRPVVYFQFDRDDYYAGHTERPGYFDYATHGFGPVVDSDDDAAAAVADALTGDVDPRYSARMAQAFPVRDGRNSERVYDAMVESRSMRSLAERSRTAQPDRWRLPDPD